MLKLGLFNAFFEVFDFFRRAQERLRQLLMPLQQARIGLMGFVAELVAATELLMVQKVVEQGLERLLPLHVYDLQTRVLMLHLVHVPHPEHLDSLLGRTFAID